MTLSELSRSLLSAIDGLALDDLMTVVDRLGLTRGRPPVPNVLRYQVWSAVEAAGEDPDSLIATANVLLAVLLGWDGAPILSLEDIRR